MNHNTLFFEASVIWKEKTTGILVAPNADDPIEVATPVEFPDGEDGKWSPESLFLGAISSCFMTTFLAFAKRKNLAFIRFRCHTEGEVRRINGKLSFEEINLYPVVHLMEEEQKVLTEEILFKVERYCLISHSIKSIIKVHATITAEEVIMLN